MFNKDTNVTDPLPNGIGAGVGNTPTVAPEYAKLAGGAAYHQQSQNDALAAGMTDISGIDVNNFSGGFGFGGSTFSDVNSNPLGGDTNNNVNDGMFQFNNGESGGFNFGEPQGQNLSSSNTIPNIGDGSFVTPNESAPTTQVHQAVNPFNPIAENNAVSRDDILTPTDTPTNSGKGKAIAAAVMIGVIGLGGLGGYTFMKKRAAAQQVEEVSESRGTLGEELSSIDDIMAASDANKAEASEPLSGDSSVIGSAIENIGDAGKPNIDLPTESGTPVSTGNENMIAGLATALNTATASSPVSPSETESKTNESAPTIEKSKDTVKAEPVKEIKQELPKENTATAMSETVKKEQVVEKVDSNNAVASQPNTPETIVETTPSTNSDASAINSNTNSTSVNPDPTQGQQTTPSNDTSNNLGFITAPTQAQNNVAGSNTQQDISGNTTKPLENRASYERKIRDMRQKAEEYNGKADALVRERNSLEQRLFNKSKDEQIEILKREVADLKSKQRKRVANARVYNERGEEISQSSASTKKVNKSSASVRAKTQSQHKRQATMKEKNKPTKATVKATPKESKVVTTVSSSKLPYQVYASSSGLVMLKTSKNSSAISYVVGDTLPNGETIKEINYFSKSLKTNRKTYTW